MVEEHLGTAVEAKEHVVKLVEETLYGKAKSLVSCDSRYGDCGTVFCEADSSTPFQEEYLSVDTLDERVKDITQEMHGVSGRSSPCTRPSSAMSAQISAEIGGSCQTGSSCNRSVAKQASGMCCTCCVHATGHDLQLAPYV